MSDDESWDKDDFVPPPILKAGPKVDEEEEEVDEKKAETVEELRSQLERLQREFTSYRKGVEAAKEVKNQKKREEEELQGMLSEVDRKAKEKLLVEQSDLDMAKDLFGASDSAADSKASAAAAKEGPKDEVTRFVDLVTTKLLSYSKAPEYTANIERLVVTVTDRLNHERLKELGDKLSADAREKAKKAKEQKKKETQAKVKKPISGGGVKANSKRFSELDDYMDDFADDYDQDDDY